MPPYIIFFIKALKKTQKKKRERDGAITRFLL